MELLIEKASIESEGNFEYKISMLHKHNDKLITVLCKVIEITNKFNIDLFSFISNC